eukprot:2833391-Pleurochrysis_carterae.AAC.1
MHLAAAPVPPNLLYACMHASRVACLAVTCAACTHEFCWRCGGAYFRDGWGLHCEHVSPCYTPQPAEQSRLSRFLRRVVFIPELL